MFRFQSTLIEFGFFRDAHDRLRCIFEEFDAQARHLGIQKTYIYCFQKFETIKEGWPVAKSVKDIISTLAAVLKPARAGKN